MIIRNEEQRKRKCLLMGMNKTNYKSYHKIIIFSLVLIILFGLIIGQKESSEEKYDFFGTWRIKKVALTSEMYTGTTLDGVREEDLYDSEDYLGYELEYSSKIFRLGDAKYKNPNYVITNITIESFDNGGRFRLPDIYTFIAEEGIKINNGEKYTSETPLIYFKIEFEEEISYKKYNFIPVGTQCVLLNHDIMLIGLWGKVLIAYRVK